MLERRCLTYLHLGGCQNVPAVLLEAVAAFCPDVQIFGHYANKVKKSDFVMDCLTGAFVYRGGGEIAKFAIFRDKSRNRRFSAKNREIDNFPRQIAI